MRLRVERRLLERVGEPFALGDFERRANAVVVGAKAHQPGDDRLVGAVALTGASKRAVQFDLRALGRTAHEAAREQPEAARAGGVRTRRPNHHRADDVEKRDHGRKVAARRLGEPLAVYLTMIVSSTLV